MKAKFIGILTLSVFTLNVFCSAPVNHQYHIVIDTDGAIDDMRAITMLLSSKEVQVLAITCSQGTLWPESVYVKVKSLLSDLQHDEIPVGVDEKLEQELPAWAPFAQNISWGNSKHNFSGDLINNNADEILNKSFENYSGNITLVALGSLKTYADWIEKAPQSISKIERIVWYNDLKVEDGFNYKVSPESFDIIKQTNIKLDIVANNSDRFLVDELYLTSIQSSNSFYAEQITAVHKQPEIIDRIRIKHLKLWDDFIPLYLTTPVVFESKKTGNISYNTIDESLSVTYIYEKMSNLFKSEE